MILLRRRQHGQPAVARPAQRWIDRGLIYADLLTTYPANAVTGRPDTLTGTKVTTTPWGLARGFGTTVGVASTDRVLTTLSGTVASRTIIVRYVRAGAGGGSAGRVFDNTQEQVNYSDGTSLLSFSRDFSTTDGAWTTPASGVGTATNTPFVFAIAYDASSTANNPGIYINGSPVTVTRATAPVGSFAAGSTAYSLGNRAAGDRAFNGSLSDFLVFDSILTDGEIAELADPSRIWADRSIWVPVAAAGATFKSAWARGCNTVISSGARP